MLNLRSELCKTYQALQRRWFICSKSFLENIFNFFYDRCQKAQQDFRFANILKNVFLAVRVLNTKFFKDLIYAGKSFAGDVYVKCTSFDLDNK